MLGKVKYSNGQKIHSLESNILTYYFKNGTIKAVGNYVDDQMEGEWKFFRETGELWQVGSFSAGKKNGSWVRYDRKQTIEYKADFIDDKEQKNVYRTKKKGLPDKELM
jgi:antitoxin component YwqK of YwqJK toxin-antitoxin module